MGHGCFEGNEQAISWPLPDSDILTRVELSTQETVAIRIGSTRFATFHVDVRFN